MKKKYKGLEICAVKGLHEKVLKTILKRNIKKESKILVLGSGTGSFDKRLADSGFNNIISSDINQENYTYSNENIKFMPLDLNSDFSAKINQDFDLIIATELIEHLSSPNKFIKECKNLLNKKGVLIISTPNLHNLQSRINFLLFGYPSYFITKPEKYGHISPIFDNIFFYILEKHNLKLEKRIPSSNYFKNFEFYTKKSYFYFLTQLFLNIFFFPLMLFNKKLLKGTNAIYLISHADYKK